MTPNFRDASAISIDRICHERFIMDMLAIINLYEQIRSFGIIRNCSISFRGASASYSNRILYETLIERLDWRDAFSTLN